MPFPLSTEQKQSFFWLAVGAALLLLLFFLWPVLSPFIAAAILAYAMNPGVDWLERKRVPRVLAVTLMMLLVGAALAAIVLVVVPVLESEVPLLQEKIPAFLTSLNNFLSPKLRALGISVNLDVMGIKQLTTQQVGKLGDSMWTSLLASARIGGSAVIGWLGTLILVPMVLFYLLMDWHPILARLQALVPRRWAGKTIDMAREVDGLLAQYLRGQLLEMLILAAYYSIALMIAGFDVALPVGILTGLLVFVPYLGFTLGLGLALIAAVLQFDGWHGLIVVGVVYGFGQILESFYLTPRLVGERIGLHPLAVIFALLAFGELFGFVGVLLALPASAVVLVGAQHLYRHYVSSSFYLNR